MEEFSSKPKLPDGAGTETKESRHPNYTLQIYFSAHGTAEDVRGGGRHQRSSPERFKRTGLVELFKHADVYVPELHGWTDLALSHLQQLSYGRVTPEQLLAEMCAEFRAEIQDPVKKKNFNPERDYPMYGFRKSEMEMIYQSYKPIVIFDVPDENPKSETLQDHELGTSKEQTSGADSFEKTLAIMKKNLRTSADLHNEREDYMLSQITPKLEEVFKDRPDLKKKPDLQVLMFLGASHTRVAHTLSSYGVKVKSQHSRSPQVFGFYSEAQRRLALGKEVDNELISKVWLEDLCLQTLWSVISGLTEDHNEMSVFVRKTVNLFTYEETKSLYKMGWPRAANEFFNYLVKKKVIIPHNHSELISFISN